MSEFTYNSGLVGVSPVEALERLASYAECPQHTGPLSLNLYLVARNVSEAVEELFQGAEHAEFNRSIHDCAEALLQHANDEAGVDLQSQLIETLRQHAVMIEHHR